MSLACDGGSMRSLIRNLIRLHSTRAGEEHGGHSTKMRCPTQSQPGGRVWWAWHKGAASYSGHDLLPMAPLAQGATEDRVPTARQRICLYNSDTAGGELCLGKPVHTQGREEQGHGVRRLPEGKGRSHCDSAAAMTTQSPVPKNRHKRTRPL